MLEVVDSGFDSISNEIDEYRKTLDSKTLNQISEVEISSLSLDRFVEAFSKQHEYPIKHIPISAELLNEVKKYGIEKLGHLEALVTDEFVKDVKATNSSDTNFGLIRDILMYNDIEKYFSGPFDWGAMDTESAEILFRKYGRSDGLQTLFIPRGL
jgi:putative GTP pyrophosphokinase